MPIVIDSYEADGEGGFYIKWTDPSQPVTAFIHATPELLDEFSVHHRVKRGAPIDKINKARDAMRDPSVSDAATVQRFRRAYEELVDDIKDLKKRNLKHNTPHAEHLAVKGRAKVKKEWMRDRTPEEFTQFRERNQT